MNAITRFTIPFVNWLGMSCTDEWRWRSWLRSLPTQCCAISLSASQNRIRQYVLRTTTQISQVQSHSSDICHLHAMQAVDCCFMIQYTRWLEQNDSASCWGCSPHQRPSKTFIPHSLLFQHIAIVFRVPNVFSRRPPLIIDQMMRNFSYKFTDGDGSPILGLIKSLPLLPCNISLFDTLVFVVVVCSIFPHLDSFVVERFTLKLKTCWLILFPKVCAINVATKWSAKGVAARPWKWSTTFNASLVSSAVSYWLCHQFVPRL